MTFTCCSGLDESSQTAVEEELSPLQCLLFLSRLTERLAASELAGDGASVVVAVGVLQVAPCAEQRSVQLQHRAAGPAAHQGELSESLSLTHTYTYRTWKKDQKCDPLIHTHYNIIKLDLINRKCNVHFMERLAGTRINHVS